MNITHPQMVTQLGKDGGDLLKSLTAEKCHAWHMSSCIMGEVAELVEGNETGDVINIGEELGDIEFYMEGFRQGVNLSRETIVQMSIGLAHKDVSLGYAAGLVVEAANMFDAVKKWIIYEQNTDRVKLANAMARFEWYMSAFRGANGITYDQTIQANIEKLGKRYPGFVYTNKAAQDRADKLA